MAPSRLYTSRRSGGTTAPRIVTNGTAYLRHILLYQVRSETRGLRLPIPRPPARMPFRYSRRTSFARPSPS
jgi:hypothetical protein